MCVPLFSYKFASLSITVCKLMPFNTAAVESHFRFIHIALDHNRSHLRALHTVSQQPFEHALSTIIFTAFCLLARTAEALGFI